VPGQIEATELVDMIFTCQLEQQLKRGFSEEQIIETCVSALTMENSTIRAAELRKRIIMKFAQKE
jgi:hypothetical protein